MRWKNRGEQYFVFVFFFKQKTAYEIVSRDWSSDVCSSDLHQQSTSPSQPLFTPSPQRCDSANMGPLYQPPQARIRPTKTAVVRRSYVTASMEDMKNRHNELTDLEISTPQRTKSSMSGFIADRRINKPFQHRFSLPTRSSQAKVTHQPLSLSSSATRRKPIYAHHLARTVKKSPHSYQHSALIGHKQKFIGRS